MKAVTEFTFYDRFNEALIQQDCKLARDLLNHAFKTFGWSHEERLRLSTLLRES